MLLRTSTELFGDWRDSEAAHATAGGKARKRVRPAKKAAKPSNGHGHLTDKFSGIPAELSSYIQGPYTTRIADIIALYDNPQTPIADTAREINRKLSRWGLSLPDQYVRAFREGKRIGRDGLSLYLAYRLGALIANSANPEESIYAFYCQVTAHPYSDRGELNEVKEQLSALTAQLAQLLPAAEKKVLPATLHPATEALLKEAKVSVASAVAACESLFSVQPSLLTEMLGIFQKAVKPGGDFWLALTCVLNEALGASNEWSITKVKKVIEPLLNTETPASKKEVKPS